MQQSISSLLLSLQSASNTTRSAIEIVHIDSSQGRQLKVITSKLQHLVDVNYIWMPPSGVYNALNAAIKVCKNNYIFFYHSDDRISRSYISLLMASMSDTCAVGSGVKKYPTFHTSFAKIYGESNFPAFIRLPWILADSYNFNLHKISKYVSIVGLEHYFRRHAKSFNHTELILPRQFYEAHPFNAYSWGRHADYINIVQAKNAGLLDNRATIPRAVYFFRVWNESLTGMNHQKTRNPLGPILSLLFRPSLAICLLLATIRTRYLVALTLRFLAYS